MARRGRTGIRHSWSKPFPKLQRSFQPGAASAGNHVQEFYLQGMEIHGCLGCEGCSRAKKGTDNPCAQSDDMAEIYKAFMTADVIVFASPLYFWTISGTLKTATDRLYAELRNLGYNAFPRKSVLLMTAGGNDYSQAVRWYETFERNLGWTNLGEVLGSGKTSEARELGVSIKSPVQFFL